VRVAVTGASGLIGSALASALEERGDDVVRFVRPGTPSTGGAVVRWDPQRRVVDEEDLARARGFDGVVHLAGVGIGDRRWSARRREEILTSRTFSTSLLIEALGSMASAPRVLASGSSVGFYGSRGDEVLDEQSPQGTGFLAEVCAQWEDAAAPLAKTGTVVASLRTGIVMSATGGALKKQLPLFRLGLGGPLSTGRQWLSPISLRDEVRAILWILDHSLGGPLNLVAPEPLTNWDFTRSLARQVHRPAMARVPAAALRIALGAGLTDEAVLASQRVVPTILTESGFVFEESDIASIFASALSYRP
jgi:uncharacterized protein (TIGR01777 family)